MSSASDRRGREIVFIDGNFDGKTGWVDNDYDETEKMIYVIIKNARRSKKTGKWVDKATRVNKSNIRYKDDLENPLSFLHAVLQQQPKLEKMMDKLCKELAMCQIPDDNTELLPLFKTKFETACLEQKLKGANATWRHIEYSRGPIGMNITETEEIHS